MPNDSEHVNVYYWFDGQPCAYDYQIPLRDYPYNHAAIIRKNLSEFLDSSLDESRALVRLKVGDSDMIEHAASDPRLEAVP